MTGPGRRLAAAGAVFLVVLTAVCVVGPLFAQDVSPSRTVEPPAGPSARHWFGTDDLGRDVFALVLRGGRASLAVGFGVAVLATIVGTTVGTMTGYFGGWLDEGVLRVVDLLLIIPILPLAAFASKIGQLGPLPVSGTTGLTVVLAFWMWPVLARVARAAVVQVRGAAFVEAARAVGASESRILAVHILPNVVGTVVVGATLAVAGAILIESSISFLDFGSSYSWGAMVARAAPTLELYPWLSVFPGLAIFLTVLSVHFVGDGLRDLFDPKLSTRR
jgi:peptide/nickel transport system permease protein